MITLTASAPCLSRTRELSLASASISIILNVSGSEIPGLYLTLFSNNYLSKRRKEKITQLKRKKKLLLILVRIRVGQTQSFTIIPKVNYLKSYQQLQWIPFSTCHQLQQEVNCSLHKFKNKPNMCLN